MQPVWAAVQVFLHAGEDEQSEERTRVRPPAWCVAAVLACVFFVPLPFSVKCTFEVQPRGGQQVFRTCPGMIKRSAVKPGEDVKAGDVIMQLENADLRAAAARI